MKNHYLVLGLNSSATIDEIRRAYRVLARRYHPDVNPEISSTEKFKEISVAYKTLSDEKRRRQFDIELEKQERSSVNEKVKAYKDQQKKEDLWKKTFKQAAEAQNTTRDRPTVGRRPYPSKDFFGLQEKLDATLAFIKKTRRWMSKPIKLFPQSSSANDIKNISKISIIEVSITMKDAICGVKKTVEISEPEKMRKVSVRVPAGVRNGSVVRLRSKNAPGEDLVLIVRIASHPFLSMQTKGLIAEVPITVSEALSGASIKVPTLEEQVLVKIPENAQSGTELRLKGKGIPLKDGTRGDLFIRLMVRVPESSSALGLQDKANELSAYYETGVRQAFPQSLMLID